MEEKEVLMMLFEAGFPVGVAAYLLIRIDARLQKLTDAITDLRIEIKGTHAEKQP
jgi:hypothetical protein